MSAKTVLITDVSGSVGKTTAFNIAKSGATTVLLVRNKTKFKASRNELVEKTGNKNIDFLVADFTDTASIKAAAMLTRLALDPQFEKSNGKFYKFNGKEMRSAAYSYELEPQEKLWKLSEQLS